MPTSQASRERSALSKIRRHMIDRCCKPDHPSYAYYGGRGITVCERWLKSPQAFIDDMGPRAPGMTLERDDNNKGYGPDNCRWATRAEQVRNRRNSIVVESDGVRMVLKDACAQRGMSYDAVWRRIRRGASIEMAFATPVQQRRPSPAATRKATHV
jgi:hypothetical protein